MEANGPRGVFGLTAVFRRMVAIFQCMLWDKGVILRCNFSGALVDAFCPRGVFGLTAVFPLMVSLSAVFISEQPVIGNSNRQKRGSEDEEDKAESGVHCTH